VSEQPRRRSAIVRALHRLVHPQYAEERQRLEGLTRTVRDASAATDARIDALSNELRDMAARLGRLALAKDLTAIDRRIDQVGDALTRQYRAIAQAVRGAAWEDELRGDERRILRRLSRLARGSRPVLVGPWSGEVGFELLYWIPFVTWALRRARVSPDRITVLSRGGPASWYAHLGGRYVDAFSLVSPDEFRSRTEAQKKQRHVGPFDRELVTRAAAAAGLERPFLLHPGLMYRLFYPFWKQQTTVVRVEKHAHYQPIARAALAELNGRLPTSYVAVRFYFSDSFPDTPDNRRFVEHTVGTLVEGTDVVMLNTGFRVDDHRDYTPGRASRIHTVDDLMAPERNLEVQTAIIAGARAFVGTYGGYAYLAPLCGVPSLAFYSVRDAFFAHHLELAERVFRRLDAGSLVPIDVRDADLIRLALAPGALLQS
jgi:hypothetical protein